MMFREKSDAIPLAEWFHLHALKLTQTMQIVKFGFGATKSFS